MELPQKDHDQLYVVRKVRSNYCSISLDVSRQYGFVPSSVLSCLGICRPSLYAGRFAGKSVFDRMVEKLDIFHPCVERERFHSCPLYLRTDIPARDLRGESRQSLLRQSRKQSILKSRKLVHVLRTTLAR